MAEVDGKLANKEGRVEWDKVRALLVEQLSKELALGRQAGRQAAVISCKLSR